MRRSPEFISVKSHAEKAQKPLLKKKPKYKLEDLLAEHRTVPVEIVADRACVEKRRPVGRELL